MPNRSAIAEVMPQPKISFPPLTWPDAVAISVAGTDPALSGPAVSAMDPEHVGPRMLGCVVRSDVNCSAFDRKGAKHPKKLVQWTTYASPPCVCRLMRLHSEGDAIQKSTSQ